MIEKKPDIIGKILEIKRKWKEKDKLSKEEKERLKRETYLWARKAVEKRHFFFVSELYEIVDDEVREFLFDLMLKEKLSFLAVMVGEKLSPERLKRKGEKLIHLLLQKAEPSLVIKGTKLVGKELTESEKSYLLERYIKEGNLEYAIETAKIANIKLTSRDFERIIAQAIKKGFEEDAEKAAKLCGRSLTLAEKILLYENISKED